MTVTQAMKRLQKALDKYGDVEVFFDCPDCKVSFTPGFVATPAVHIANKKPDVTEVVEK